MVNNVLFENILASRKLRIEYLNAVDSINEGLIVSYPISKVIQYLGDLYSLITVEEFQKKMNASFEELYNSRYNGIIWKITERNKQEKIAVIVLDNFKDDAIEKINKKLNLLGYIYTGSSLYGKFLINNEIKQWSALYYEKKFAQKVPIDLKTQKYFYHITTEKKYEKIKVQGLKPMKSQQVRYYHDDERIYFYMSMGIYEFYNYAKNKFAVEMNIRKGTKLVLLRIDLQRLDLNKNDKNKINFYYDPRLDDAVYTHDSINPNAIEKIAEATV